MNVIEQQAVLEGFVKYTYPNATNIIRTGAGKGVKFSMNGKEYYLTQNSSATMNTVFFSGISSDLFV